MCGQYVRNAYNANKESKQQQTDILMSVILLCVIISMLDNLYTKCWFFYLKEITCPLLVSNVDHVITSPVLFS